MGGCETPRQIGGMHADRHFWLRFRTRTLRHAEPDFLRLACHGVGGHSVDADDSERKRSSPRFLCAGLRRESLVRTRSASHRLFKAHALPAIERREPSREFHAETGADCRSCGYSRLWGPNADSCGVDIWSCDGPRARRWIAQHGQIAMDAYVRSGFVKRELRGRTGTRLP